MKITMEVEIDWNPNLLDTAINRYFDQVQYIADKAANCGGELGENGTCVSQDTEYVRCIAEKLWIAAAQAVPGPNES